MLSCRSTFPTCCHLPAWRTALACCHRCAAWHREPPALGSPVAHPHAALVSPGHDWSACPTIPSAAPLLFLQVHCGIEMPFLLVSKDTTNHKRTSGGDGFEIAVESESGAVVGSSRIVDRGTGTYECFYRSGWALGRARGEAAEEESCLTRQALPCSVCHQQPQVGLICSSASRPSLQGTGAGSLQDSRARRWDGRRGRHGPHSRQPLQRGGR